MKRNRVLILILCLLFISFVAVGCGSTQSSEVKVESGVINKDYSGTVCPNVSQEYKLDEQAKEGMIKVRIKCGVEKEIPVGDSAEKEEQAGDSNEAKPKI